MFVTCRLITMDGDPSRFVLAGSRFVDPGAAPRTLHVEPADGYDGQFFYLLALAPANHEPPAFGGPGPGRRLAGDRGLPRTGQLVASAMREPEATRPVSSGTRPGPG